MPFEFSLFLLKGMGWGSRVIILIMLAIVYWGEGGLSQGLEEALQVSFLSASNRFQVSCSGVSTGKLCTDLDLRRKPNLLKLSRFLRISASVNAISLQEFRKFYYVYKMILNTDPDCD